jgi:cell division protein FtsL
MLARFLAAPLALSMCVSTLALYNISERYRIADLTLFRVERQIGEEEAALKDMQTKYTQLSRSDRIQEIAEADLGMKSDSTVQLASFEQLPRRESETRVREVSAPAGAPMLVKISARSADSSATKPGSIGMP